MKKYSRKGGKRRGGKRAIIKRALAKGWKRSVAKVCKRVISRQAETKSLSVNMISAPYSTHAAYYISTLFKANNIVTLTPTSVAEGVINLSLGNEDGQRIGNRVRPVKLIYRGVLCPAKITAAGGTNPSPFIPCEVKLVIFSLKRQLTESKDSVFNVMTNSMFNAGNSSLGITQGSAAYNLVNLWDMVKVFNDDVITVHKTRTFKIGGQYTQTVANNSGGGASNPNVADFNYNQKFAIDCTRYCPKNVTFNDADLTSTSKQIYAAWIVTEAAPVTPADYNPTGVYYRQPITLYSSLDFQYKDM